LSLDEKKEQVELSGNTLLVYLYVLKKGHNCGVREVQRMLGFSSSSTAHYHLEKLTCKGILTKDQYGNYEVNEKVKVGRISSFIFLRGFVFPTQLIYAITTTLMCISFLGFFWKFLTPTTILALSPGIVASAIFWYDTIRLWQSLPSFKGSVR
jgi:predicted DNA-binding transcriptional regulator